MDCYSTQTFNDILICKKTYLFNETNILIFSNSYDFVSLENFSYHTKNEINVLCLNWEEKHAWETRKKKKWR